MFVWSRGRGKISSSPIQCFSWIIKYPSILYNKFKQDMATLREIASYIFIVKEFFTVLYLRLQRATWAFAAGVDCLWRLCYLYHVFYCWCPWKLWGPRDSLENEKSDMDREECIGYSLEPPLCLWTRPYRIWWEKWRILFEAWQPNDSLLECKNLAYLEKKKINLA